jgi:Protein of unknown function (DUF4058)
MRWPFPGMNPYLEAPHLWPDVHSSLIFAIRTQIQAQLSPRYSAAITPYVALESLEIRPSRMAVPDVAVLEQDSKPQSQGNVAILPAPMTRAIVMEVPTRYTRLEIRSIENEKLVTAIELLSPANKRPGTEGIEAYEKKRQEFFKSDAHLLELDLLRAGQRLKFTQPLPDNPYFIFLSHVEKRPLIDVWPLSLREMIPAVPVPLLQPDPDVVLDVQKALSEIYESAKYERRIDYTKEPPPPAFSAEDMEWLEQNFQEAKSEL